MKLIECVPNFSEGRDMKIIDQITDVVKEIEEVTLLDADPGDATNRTVVTIIGTPEGIKEVAFQVIKKASEIIDMSKHKGAHGRMGATDVCPFIPVSEVTMEDCVRVSEEVGERVGRELGIPVYLYEYSARTEERKNLANIRAGEYEGLEKKLRDPHWKPDFGEAKFNPHAGATVMGAREFLIAYNINLNTTDKKLAKEIALNIREKGRWKRDENNKIVRDEKGNKVRQPGKFDYCKAVGWYIEEYNQAQVSMNLTNYKITPFHLVFDEVCRQADKLGLRVTGSELVGLIPKDAMIAAGKHYLRKQGKSVGESESELVRIAIQSMGLEDISPFDPKKKIIESYVEDRPDALVNMTLAGFADELASDSPAPGGGSVAALAGALSVSLSAMVANLTYMKKGYKDVSGEMDELSEKGQIMKKKFLDAIDSDTDAFNRVMKAMKKKAKTPEAEEEKKKEVEEATKKATLVPFEVLNMAVESLDLAMEAAMKGNKNSVSDAGVAALTACASAHGAYYNVMINLPGIEDEKFKTDITMKANKAIEKADRKLKEVQVIVNDALGLTPSVV
ncbi:MAG: glutamate formimidoyltransferase [Candidatus Eremiobacteraeota bacterium]|nr:glutamate formimidoyltransferase [Candidatus Eremiobacteraeota bacterium]